MSMDPRIKHSFALTSRYKPHYSQRCGDALDEALNSTQAYDAWRTLDPGHASPVFSRFAALPALTKRELRAGGPQGFVPHGRDIAEGLTAHEIELVATTGATGDQVTNVWYQPWWNASEAASWQLNAHARAVATGAHREAILTSPWCAGFPCEDGYLTTEQRTLGRFLFLSERSDPSSWSSDLMDRMVEELNAFKPVVLEANPSFLARLSRHIVRRRLHVYSPALIVLTYENPSVLHRRQIHRAFDAPIASSYGATEAGYVFMECEAGRLHQVTTTCHVDFLPFAPEHGGPDVGRILVTIFGNPWRSLVRFDVGDVVRVDGHAPCPCGHREGLTLMSVEGRTMNLTVTPEGRAVTQGAVDDTLGSVAGLVEYQLLQTGSSAYHLRFSAEGAAVHSVANEACDALQTVYGPAAVITADFVEAIAPDPPGKYCLSKRLEPIDPDILLDDQFSPSEL
jgi:phenylacetate-coenzyme A ligase PaaK-like adenylate-forming protein